MTQGRAHLTAEELVGLLQSLTYYSAGDHDDPGSHCHVGDDGGPELTIAIENWQCQHPCQSAFSHPSLPSN